MLDTLLFKDIDMSAVGSTQLPGSARTFSRTQAPRLNEYFRRSTHVSSLSPTDLRIVHSPRTPKNPRQRSTCQLIQVLTRFDASSNPVSSTKFEVGLSCYIPADVTLAEFRAAVKLLIGGLVATDGEMITALYNGEV